MTPVNNGCTYRANWSTFKYDLDFNDKVILAEDFTVNETKFENEVTVLMAISFR